MSLMNDALRKKNREMTDNPVTPGFSEQSAPGRGTRRWLTMLVPVILLTAVALAGIHLVQSDAGNDLLLKPSPAEKASPAAKISGTTVRLATPSAEPTAANGSPETADAMHKQQRATPAAGHESSPSAVPAHDGTTADAIDDEYMVAKAPPARASSIETPNKQPSVEPNVVSRTFEPGPDQKVDRPAPPDPASRQAPKSDPARSMPKSGRIKPFVTGQRADNAVEKSVPSAANNDLFYKKALAYHRSGRFNEAIRVYRQLLISDPDHTSAMLNLSGAYMQRRNYVDALSLLNRLEKTTPRPRGVLLNQAIAMIGMDDPEQALSCLDRADRAKDASLWEIRFHRAVALARLARFSEARALYRTVEKDRPGDARIQFNLALTCDAMGLYPEALIHYEAALRILPEPSEVDKQTVIHRMRTIRRYLNTDASAAGGR